MEQFDILFDLVPLVVQVPRPIFEKINRDRPRGIPIYAASELELAEHFIILLAIPATGYLKRNGYSQLTTVPIHRDL